MLRRLEFVNGLPSGNEIVEKCCPGVAHGGLPIALMESFSNHVGGNLAFDEQERHASPVCQLPNHFTVGL